MRPILPLILASAALLATACRGEIKDLTNGELSPYVDRFFVAAGNKEMSFTENLTLDFGDRPGANGVCFRKSFEEHVITIRESYWRNITDAAREQLMFHELGHCLLNRDHRADLLKYGFYSLPVSVMYPSMFSDTLYSPNRAYYLRELFESK
jgi:hypothetical protein